MGVQSACMMKISPPRPYIAAWAGEKKGVKNNMRPNRFCSEIIDIDDYVHIVRGKVICFTSDVYDLSVGDNVEALLRFADDLYVDPTLPACFGKDSICELYPPHRSDARCTCYCQSIDCLSPDVQAIVRCVLDAKD